MESKPLLGGPENDKKQKQYSYFKNPFKKDSDKQSEKEREKQTEKYTNIKYQRL